MFSGKRRELYRFGGHPAPDTAWSYNLYFQKWTARVLEPTGRPERVVAAAYRASDNFVYSADRKGLGIFIRLRRWQPSTNEFEFLGSLPAAWNLFDRHWLVTNERGELFLVGSGIAFTVIVRLDVSPSGELSCGGVRKLLRRVVDRPHAGRNGLSLTVKTLQGFRGEVVDYDDLGALPKGWCPAHNL